MSNLVRLVRQLRLAATTLEALLGLDPATGNETTAVERAIRDDLRGNTKDARQHQHKLVMQRKWRKAKKQARKAAKAAAKNPAKKGFKYRGTHWTQTPSGKRKLSRGVKRAYARRKAILKLKDTSSTDE